MLVTPNMLLGAPDTLALVAPHLKAEIWDEPSMDQGQSRGQLLGNFQRPLVHTDFPENKAPRDWSIQISSEIHMDQWLQNLPESAGLNRHRSRECSFLKTNSTSAFL